MTKLEEIAKRAYSTIHTVRASYAIARVAIEQGVPGDFVECGVAAGVNAAAMALGILDWCTNNNLHPVLGHQRRVHLFDSFTGIPQAGPEDVEFLAAKHPPGLTCHSRAEVERNMREWGIPSELLVYHEGLFEETVLRATALRTFPGDLPNTEGVHKVAVLRLDGDLYESTRVCLENLLPLVSPGGWVIVDDFDLSGARKAVMDIVGHGFGPVYFQRHGGA